MSWLKLFLTRKSPLAEPPSESKDVELREGTAEFDEFVVRAEIERGENLAHGAGHLANLLHFGPGNREWMALFDDYFDRSGGQLEALIPRGEQLFAATEAMRALIWHRHGRLHDAVQLMLQVTPATHPRYLHEWVLGWVEPDGAIESLPEAAAQHLVVLALTTMPEWPDATAAQRREARRWAAIAERVARRTGGGSRTLMWCAGILRKAGLFDEALTLVNPAYQAAPDWNTAIAVGLILRRRGDLTAASEAFEAAARADPDTMSTYLEGGDTFFENDRWQEARAWYARALAKDPAQEWAGPSDLFCQWKLTGEQQFLDRLIELAEKGNQRAHGLLSAAYDQPYQPEDASAGILRQVLEQMAAPKTDEADTAKLGVSSLEAPSNGLAFTLAFAARGRSLTIHYQVAAIPKPDPREPLDAVRYRLWTYEGTNARPGLAPPSDRVRQAVANLAGGSFNRERSFARASRVAEQLGAEAIPEILAVMVYPPPLPAGREALEYIPRIQLEALHVVAHVNAHEGWQNSQRRAALMSVLFGPTDWTTNAAIDVLTTLAQRHPALGYDIHKTFQFLEQGRPDGGFCCWLGHLYRRWRSLPLLSDREREELGAKLRAEQGSEA